MWTGPERKANKEGYDYVHNYMLVEIGGKKVLCYRDKKGGGARVSGKMSVDVLG